MLTTKFGSYNSINVFLLQYYLHAPTTAVKYSHHADWRPDDLTSSCQPAQLHALNYLIYRWNMLQTLIKDFK